jgi:hypothetical protein
MEFIEEVDSEQERKKSIDSLSWLPAAAGLPLRAFRGAALELKREQGSRTPYCMRLVVEVGELFF